MATEKRLIDANALLEHLTRCIEASKGLMRSVCVAIKCFVEQMPTVDAVEVVHGRWIKRTEVFGEIYCSECRTIEKTTDSNFKTPFCPWCGAEMDMEVDK